MGRIAWSGGRVEIKVPQRDKRMKQSVLDDVQGLGPTRRKRLLKEMGSMRKVKAATLEELQAFSWLPDAVAENVWNALHRGA